MRYQTIYSAVIVALLALPHLFLAMNNRFDDYLITLRYGINASKGLGAVFNTGIHYQGFTSPLQFLMSFTLAKAGIDKEIIPSIISLTGLLLLIVIGMTLSVWILGRASGAGSFVCVSIILSSSLLSLVTPFDSVWAAGFIFMAFSCLRNGHYKTMGFLSGLSILARHDAILAVLVLGLALLYRREWRGFLDVTTYCTLVTLPWYLWALFYYGAALPSTLKAKIAQGCYGSSFLGSGPLRAIGRLLEWYPMTDSCVVGSCLLLIVACIVVIRRFDASMILSDRGSICRAGWRNMLRNPFILFVLFTIIHYLSYFIILRVPPVYPWYQTNMVITLLIVPCFFFLRALSVIQSFTFSEGLSGPGLRMKIPLFLVAVSIIALCLTAWFQNVTTIYQENNPGRYRYEGYRACAEYLSEVVGENEFVSAGEIGVLGYYGEFNILDKAALVMPHQPEQRASFRYAVRTDDPQFPPTAYILDNFTLIKTFPTPIGINILLFERNNSSAQ